MKILVNADDFGLTKGINEGVIDAHINGVVTRTTLMMNGMAVEDAIKLAKETPSLKVGIHLTLSFGKPLNKLETNLLTNDSGHFKYTSTEVSLTQTEIEQVKIEWTTQIEEFLKTGLTLDHIDSHHHVHGWQDLKTVVQELSDQYNLPVRYTESLKDKPEQLLTENLWLNFYKEGINDQLFEELSSLPYHSIEVMVHPAVVDTDLRQISSYTDFREKETQILKTLKVKECITLI